MLLRGFDWLRQAITPLVLWEYDPFTGQVYTGTTPLSGQEQRSNCGPGKRPARNPVVMPDGTHHFPCVPVTRETSTPVPPVHQGEPCPEGQYRPSNREPCRPMPHDPRVSDREVVCRNRGWVWDGEKCVDPARIEAGGKKVKGWRDETAPKRECEKQAGMVYRTTPTGDRCLSVQEWGCIQAGRTWDNGQCRPKGDGNGGGGGTGGGGTGGGGTGGGGVGGGGTGAELPAPERIRQCGPGEVPDGAGGCRSVISDIAEQVGVTPGGTGESYAGGGFPALIDQPPEFRPMSFGDVLGDPRYLTAAREQDRALRASAAASGVRGAPLLGAQARAKQGLLGNVAGLLFDQDAAAHGINMARGQDTYNRLAGDFARRLTPIQLGLQHSLGQQGLNLGAQQALWGRDDSMWNRWWLPTSQQRQQQHQMALGRQGGVFGLLNSIFSGGGYQPAELPI